MHSGFRSALGDILCFDQRPRLRMIVATPFFPHPANDLYVGTRLSPRGQLRASSQAYADSGIGWLGKEVLHLALPGLFFRLPSVFIGILATDLDPNLPPLPRMLPLVSHWSSRGP